MTTAKNERGEPVTTGVDHTHTIYVKQLEDDRNEALAALRRISIESLNQAGQYRAVALVEQAIDALNRDD